MASPSAPKPTTQPGTSAVCPLPAPRHQRMVAALQASEGVEVETVIKRLGSPLTLKLTPQRWSGRGLLGCGAFHHPVLL
jgi:hypothetical protein